MPRLNAQWPVIIAAALTTLVAAAMATTFAVFSVVSLPRAVRHSLTAATGTALVISGRADASQAPVYTSLLRRQIRSALDGAPFVLDSAEWSDPLGFAAGPGSPAPGGAGGNTPIAQAAALSGVRAHAALVSGRWPGALEAGQPIPAALPETAAALLHVRAGDRLRMRDQISNRAVAFLVTGLYRPRQLTGPAAGYWALNDIGFTGSSTSGGFTTYGPLTVPSAAFAGPLAVSAGSWVAQPATALIPESQFGQVATNVAHLAQSLPQSSTLSTLALATGLPTVLDGAQNDLSVARSLLAIGAVLVALLAAAALLVVARLLAGQRENESAMLTARGATRGQLARLALAEAIPLCVIAAGTGGAGGLWLAGRLAGTSSAPVTTALAAAWPAAVLVAVGAPARADQRTA